MRIAACKAIKFLTKIRITTYMVFELERLSLNITGIAVTVYYTRFVSGPSIRVNTYFSRQTTCYLKSVMADLECNPDDYDYSYTNSIREKVVELTGWKDE